MRLSLGIAVLCALVAIPTVSAQRPIQQREVNQRNVTRGTSYSPNMPVVARSQAGEALRIVEFQNLNTGRGSLAEQYKGLRMNRDNMRDLYRNSRTLGTATPRAIIQRYPEGQFIRRGGQAFRVMPGRSVSSF